jgi:hypothetical protein
LHTILSVKFRASDRIKQTKSMILSRTLSVTININLTYLIFLFGILSVSGISQNPKIINLDEIPQRKVRKYIISRKIDTMSDFSSIKASCKKENDGSDFHMRQKEFNLKYDLKNVWNCYNNIDPRDIWSKHSLQFGLLISKCSNSVTYVRNATFTAVDTGQVYFLNLKLLKGLFNIAVAFEVINVDQKRQVVEFSYIDNNKAKGKQIIEFYDNGNGCTRIVHRSYFKSESSFRDNLLYPMFHKKFIREFHRNMGQIIKNSNPVIIM